MVNEEVDFDKIVKTVTGLSERAQATFVYKLIGKLPIGVAKKMHQYINQRLNPNGTHINERQDINNPVRKSASGKRYPGKS